MYSIFLSLHSGLRWVLLIVLIALVFRAFKAWFGKTKFDPLDNKLRTWTVILSHLQLVIGLVLYFTSPVIKYFMENFKVVVKESATRFFGLEHNIMMLIAIILITVGSVASKKRTTDEAQYKTIAIWFSIALIIILISIPWPFSPFAERPYFRGF